MTILSAALCGQTPVWQTNGTTIYTTPASTRVGIGTTSPATSLHVKGTGVLVGAQYLDGDTANYGLVVATNQATANYAYLGVERGGNAGMYLTQVASQFAIGSHYDGSSPYLVINNAAANVGNVGIGTTNPTALLHLEANAGAPYVWLKYTADNTMITQIQRTGNGTEIRSFDHILLIPGSGSGTGNVGIGVAAPQYKLSVNGTIGTKEVIVTSTGWADYVFMPQYQLTPLSEVAAYIREHGGLPEIPSAKEVGEKGVSLGDMQVKLLAKVEELTLHLIQLDERNRELEKEIRDLKATRMR